MKTPLSDAQVRQIKSVLSKWFIDQMDAVTKSKEISDEFYLMKLSYQRQTVKCKEKLVSIAVDYMLKLVFKQGLENTLSADDETNSKILLKAVKYATKEINKK